MSSGSTGPRGRGTHLRRYSSLSQLYHLHSTKTNYSALLHELEDTPQPLPRLLRDLRVKLYMLFEEPRSSLAAQVVSVLILCFIITSIVCFMLETMPELKDVPEDVWLGIEVTCTAMFTMEFVIRFLVCSVKADYTMWLFMRNPMNLIDLFAILPFYIWLFLGSFHLAKALGVLRTVRLIRLFRIFKLGRYSSGMYLMAEALIKSSQALWVLCFFLAIGVLLSASAIYYVERMGCPYRDDLAGSPSLLRPGFTELDDYVAECRASKTGLSKKHGLCCDEHGSPLDFPSIVEAFWWSVITMTTVGFGEVYPRTDLGRIVATLTMFLGILLIALPIAIIGRTFQESYDDYVSRHGLGVDEDDGGDSALQDRALGEADLGAPAGGRRSRRRSSRTISASSGRLLHPLLLGDPAEAFRVGERVKYYETVWAEVTIVSNRGDGHYDIALHDKRRLDAQQEMLHDVPAKFLWRMEESDAPSILAMQSRLRRLKLPDSSSIIIARDIADSLGELSDLQQEITTLNGYEQRRQKKVFDQFDGMLTRLISLHRGYSVLKKVGWTTTGSKNGWAHARKMHPEPSAQMHFEPSAPAAPLTTDFKTDFVAVLGAGVGLPVPPQPPQPQQLPRGESSRPHSPISSTGHAADGEGGTRAKSASVVELGAAEDQSLQSLSLEELRSTGGASSFDPRRGVSSPRVAKASISMPNLGHVFSDQTGVSSTCVMDAAPTTSLPSPHRSGARTGVEERHRLTLPGATMSVGPSDLTD